MAIVPLRYPNAKRNPLQLAITALKTNGHLVQTADIPGLLFLDGREVTIAQLIQISSIDLKD